MGFSLATATLVGQNIGAGQIERAALVGRASGAISFTALCILGVLGFIFAEPVARLFVPNDAYVMHEAALFIRIMSVSFGFIGLQNACAGVLRGAGLMTKTMLITVIAQWIVQFPLAYALAERTPLGSHGIYWAISIANFVACGLAFVMFARGDWKNVRLIETTPD
jgi:Na+-driven multidrug efflux pump